MFPTTRRRTVVILPIVLLFTTPVFAQGPVAQDPNDWAKKMFDSLQHDFGVVARGAEVTHHFKVTNLYAQDVHISNVTTTCGCTAPKFVDAPVKSRESTEVDISMDTNKFTHEKSSNVTIYFDQPLQAAVTIPVKVYIRSDVVVTPSSINYGSVERGAPQERTMSVAYAYNDVAGRPDWKILKVVSNNKSIDAKVVETARANGNISYDVVVKLLPSAPVGLLREQIALVTDDANNPEIPVLVQARVEADVTVSPSLVSFGAVSPGGQTTKTVVFHGRKPFVIDKIECESARGAFKMRQLTKETKPYHVLSLTFDAPKNAAGPYTEKFTVTVAGRPEPLVFTARGIVETPQAPQQVKVP